MNENHVPRHPLTHWLAEAATVLMPIVCAGCGTPDVGVCAICRVELVPRLVTVRAGPGQPTGPLELPVPVTAALDYGGVVARVLGSVKEHGRTDALRPLAPAMRAAIAGALESAEVGSGQVRLVAMPSASATVRRRGHRPVDDFVRLAGYPLARRPQLGLTRPIADQAGLSADERRANLRGAMVASASLRGCAVLLVDDVLTTGSTLAEAHRAVLRQGGFVVGAACLARTIKRMMTRSELIGDSRWPPM